MAVSTVRLSQKKSTGKANKRQASPSTHTRKHTVKLEHKFGVRFKENMQCLLRHLARHDIEPGEELVIRVP